MEKRSHNVLQWGLLKGRKVGGRGEGERIAQRRIRKGKKGKIIATLNACQGLVGIVRVDVLTLASV